MKSQHNHIFFSTAKNRAIVQIHYLLCIQAGKNFSKQLFNSFGE